MAINNKKIALLIMIGIILTINLSEESTSINFGTDLQPFLIAAYNATGTTLDWVGRYNGSLFNSGYTTDKNNVENTSFNMGVGGATKNYVNISDSPMLNTSRNWSISSWVYLTQTTNEINTIFSGTSGENPHFEIRATNEFDKHLFVRCRKDGSSISEFNNSNNVTPNTWTHIVVTYSDNNNLTIFIDNVTNASNSNFNCFDNAIRTEWSIGALGNGRGNQNFAGKLDEVMVFNKTLTFSEINYLYANYNTWYNPANTSITFSPDAFANSSYHSKNYIYINVTVAGSYSYFNISLFNSTNLINTTNSTSVTSVNFTNLNDGTYYFNATIYDSPGNYYSTTTRTVFLDTLLNNVSFNYNESQYINRGNIFINASCTDTNLQNLTIKLYNSTLANINSTTSTTTPFAINYTNLLNSTHYYNITCFDKALNVNYSSTINTTIDTVLPFLINNSLSVSTLTTGSTLSIYADVNDSLTPLSSISVIIVDANNVSISGSPFSMSLLSGTSWRYNYITSPTGTFYVRNYTITDAASNVNVTTSNLSFIVNPVGSSGGGGGGGGATLIQLVGTNETFTMLTETGGKEYNLYIIAGGTREKYVVIKNTGSKKHTYTLSCEGTICATIDYGGIDKTPSLDVNEQKEYTIKIIIPQLAKHNDQYTGKIYLENEYGYEQYLAVSATVQPLAGAFFKYLEAFRGKSDMTSKLGITAINPSAKPVFLPNLLIIVVFEALFAVVILAFFKSTILRNLIFANGLLVILLGSVIWLA